jgi:hypothetical protein
MATSIRLVPLHEDTRFTPLGVLGYCVTRTHFLEPIFSDLVLPLKTVEHSIQDKLQDVLVSILAGCRAISQVNTRLRPDDPLAQAWQRKAFAEQSSLARTLDAFGADQVAQLRAGSEAWFRRSSRTLQHAFASNWLWLDLDFTPLPISKRAEASTKGKLEGKKNQYGRQLARVSAPQYHETLFSQLYPGNQPNNPAYIPTLQALDRFLALAALQKQRTILRTDAGFGSDRNLDYALDEDWQILSKGFSGSRAAALSRKVALADWLDLGKERWVARVAHPPVYVRPVQYLLLRWLTPQQVEKHAAVICSILEWPAADVIAHYDDRARCETEIQADKGGLKLRQRRKLRLPAQEALVLLTDIAHNLLAWAAEWMFPDGPLAKYGTTRLLEDVLTLSGRLKFDGQRLAEVQLNEKHPHAQEVGAGLQRLCEHFGWP